MGFAEERIELLSRLRQLLPGRAPGDAFLLDQRVLRFHLGTSLADLRVPIAVDPALARIFVSAALDLLFLLCIRHQKSLRREDYDALLLLDGFEPKNGRPQAFTAPPQVTREGVRKAFVDAPELHPALDSGVIAGWITQGRPGRQLLSALNALFRRAREESGGQEPTPYLAILALRNLVEPTMAALRPISLGQQLSRAFSGAVGTGLFLALQMAVREALVLEGSGGGLVEAGLSPLPFLSFGRLAAGSGVQAWGVAFPDSPPRVDIFAHRFTSGATLDAVEREAMSDLISSREVARRAERGAALAVVREDILEILRTGDGGRLVPITVESSTLGQLYSTPGALERVFSSGDRRKELQQKAKASIKTCPIDGLRPRLERLARAAKEWRDEDPASGWLGAAEAQKIHVRAVCALAADLALERMLAHAAQSLLHRTGTENEAGIEGEHARGQLYLLALDERPLLAARPPAPQMGHLFCDVKDFTRRTAFLKETVVADFLSREFYTPILTAAGRHQHGATHLGDKGGIYLNNLLGDAVSFSGDVVALVELSHDIRRALQSYERRLEVESSRDTVARSAAAVEEKFAARKAALERSLQVARAAHARGVKDPESGEEPALRARSLAVELARLEDERQSDLALARGEKLEAGIFISYGAAPEVATFEDPVFGSMKVSIAEKINESARGTARTGGVRARIDSLLQKERTERKNPELVCPFHVLVSQPLSIPVTAEVELAVRACIAHGDVEGAQVVLSDNVRGFVSRLSSQGGLPSGGDIYNGGIALSEEALRAYVSARVGDFLYLQERIAVADLHPAIRERFVFPSEKLALVAAVGEASQSLHELYVFVGRALFKGFEKTGGLGIYELIAPHAGFFSLIAQHHLPRWLEEHQRGAKDAAVPGLPPTGSGA